MLIFIFKGILILLLNSGLGYFFFFPLKLFLFYPREKIYIFGRHIPLTPGYIPKKKKFFYQRIKMELHQYIDEALHPEKKSSRIKTWEDSIYKKAWEQFEFLENYRFVPSYIKIRMHALFSTLVYEVMKQFLRNFVPWLLNKYAIENKIDTYNEKIELEVIEHYFQRYFYRFIQWPALLVGFLSGIFNMIMFWILG